MKSIEDSHPAILSPEQYELVQELLNDKTNGKQGIFSGKVRCADCGGTYGPKVWHSTGKNRNVETDEMLSGLNAKERRRIRKHSQDMENFLRDEAFEDQEKGLSRTYLFVNDGKLVAYLALCNDAIRLEFEERDNMELPYTTVPAVKVARLAVSVGCQGKGIGKEALQFAIYVSQMVRDYSSVVFLTLDCYEYRVGYYERFGFQRNLYQPVVLDYDSSVSMRLWIDEYLAEKSDEITVS